MGERVLAATPLYIGAAAQETVSTQTDSQSSNAEGYIQSPFLDAESILPPVAERLPLVPLVMEAGTEVQPKGLSLSGIRHPWWPAVGSAAGRGGV